MDQKHLINKLALSYSPICNYDFTILKDDPYIQQAIEDSDIYVITQRPLIYFNNVTILEKGIIEFEIKQNENPSTLKFKVPIFQENLGTELHQNITFHFGFLNESDKTEEQPLKKVSGIKIYSGNDEAEEHFLVWFSPDKFLYDFWKGHVEAEIEGTLNDFTKYNIHYVGQSTKQKIWKRLTGHEKLQNVLSLESPFTYGNLPTHEITLLFFNFLENIQMQTFDINSPVDGMVDSYLGNNFPEKRTISLDIEKALIKAMSPKYNDILFKKYPKSNDGLYTYKYNTILYTIDELITFQYSNGCIKGGDLIIIRNQNMELYKNQNYLTQHSCN